MSAIANNTASTDMVIGLKTQVKRQVGLKNYQEEIAEYNQSCLIDMWKCLCGETNREFLTKKVWEYVENSPTTFWKKEMSGVFGIKSTIGIYTNKGGKESMAHYTENGNYLGSTKKYGEHPISYEGNFRITKDKYDIDFDRIKTMTKINGVYPFASIFKAKGSNPDCDCPVCYETIPFANQYHPSGCQHMVCKGCKVRMTICPICRKRY
jgi:hypothetical protein